MGPFHPVGENPTYALERDLELIEQLDELGFDEAWVGEHHSGGWETVTAPEIFLGIAAERTKHIRLGTGVVSLPYHHPFMVAERIVLLDHLTRGRIMMGVGPGALPSDALMLGIPPDESRARMEEALGIILRLFTSVEPLTYKSSWFELRDARLQLRPYTHPHVPVAVTAVASPSGMVAAGKHGTGVLSFGLPKTSEAFWGIAEQAAEEHGKTVDRSEWRLVIPVHLAETRKDAFEQCREGAVRFQHGYRETTLGIPRGFESPLERLPEEMVERGSWCIGTPDDLAAMIERLQVQSGGFGGFMIQPVDWAAQDAIVRSHELVARYVMPRFQGSLDGLRASQADVSRSAEQHHALRNAAVQKAQDDFEASAAD